jgi:hypothetical protein
MLIQRSLKNMFKTESGNITGTITLENLKKLHNYYDNFSFVLHDIVQIEIAQYRKKTLGKFS